MCGIIGYTGNSKAAPILLDGLEKLEYRGYDSAGIALLENGIFSVEKTTERIAELKAQTQYGRGVVGSIGIGHTRWATHGAPCFENAHPHLSYDQKFALV
ncbi:MAG: glutamine--fructose-6-phosphate aminotransferase, partial [Clostridia bacterium]|nr:glutamine--fructose-6-phosphate aminotransferase [Clostridia bacterium]